MKKRVLSMLLALAAAINLAACAGSGQPSAAGAAQESSTIETEEETTEATAAEDAAESAAAGTDAAQAAASDSAGTVNTETIMFTDDSGREVEIPAHITRIVPSGPMAQIVLFAIAPEMFVGLGAKWDENARGIVPDEYFDLPYFGQLYGSANLNIEELAKQEPQLILDVGEAKGSIVEDMDTLQAQTNIPAVFVSATLETMPQAYRTLGKILGKEEKGEELAAFCEKILARTDSIMEQVGDNKADILYITGEEGLNVLAYSSFHAELIDRLTNNIAVVDSPSSKGSGNEVSMEQLMAWDPDYIVFAPGSVYSKAADDPTWSLLTAIENGNYVETPEGPHNWMGNPPSVQRYLGMIWLPSVLYPQYCDYDVKADVLEYYRLFYSCDLTDEQYENLTANAFIE